MNWLTRLFKRQPSSVVTAHQLNEIQATYVESVLSMPEQTACGILDRLHPAMRHLDQAVGQ